MKPDPGKTRVYSIYRPVPTPDGQGGMTRIPVDSGFKERGRITPVTIGKHISKERDVNKVYNLDLVGTFRHNSRIQLDDVLVRGNLQARVVGIKDPGGRGHQAQFNLLEVQGAPQTQ